MSLYVISDPHLSFGTDKPMDIFRGWTDYEKRLESQWRALITDDDFVVIPGDISWAMSLEEAKKDFEFLNALPGTKIIGKGNHDYWWGTLRKMQMFLDENNFNTIKFLFNNAYRCGDYAVCGTRGWFFDSESEDVEKVLKRESGRLLTSIKAAKELGGTPVAFLHYPAVYDGKVCDEIFSVLKSEGITRCYFGHIHAERTGRFSLFEYDNIKFSLVSADFLEFCPKKVML